MRRSPALFLTLIILLAVFAGFFIYPKGFGGKNLPWKLGLDLVGGSHLVYQVDLSLVQPSDQDSVLGGIRDVIERRVNLYGVAEPQIFIAKSRDEANLVVELAGVKNISEAIKQIGETPLLDFREVEAHGTSTVFVQTNLTGRYITGAQVTFNNQTIQTPQISLSFNDEGGQIFEKLTEANIGKPIAIFLDNALIELPTVQEKISGGKALITGQFTLAEAKKLVERFNAGALPAPINLISQQTISASLGADSLKKAAVGGLIGTILVMIFMVAYYRKLGIFASLALLIYILLTLGVFKLIPITLSLAGLAGFIITIGMAVDANILIFERMKEEKKIGLKGASLLDKGFGRAWPSIRDSNVSTVITAVILYYFTSSFVRGFALTLLIGVLISMFSAITTTRLFMRIFLKEKLKPS